MKNLSLKTKAILLIVLIILIDQCVKIYIKTHFGLYEQVAVLGNWFYLHFTENPGMAYGMQFGGTFGKMLLTLFRIVALGAIGWYILRLIKKGTKMGVVLGLSAILAGALGNLIDNLFYGLLFDKGLAFNQQIGHWIGYAGTATMNGGGYASFFNGVVVDMLYFPMIETTLPNWIPVWGGTDFTFFSPVFNIADSAITCGVIYLIIFERKFFSDKKSESQQA